MEYKDLHPWDVDYKEAVRIQEELRGKLVLKDLKTLKDTTPHPTLVAGADVSYAKGSNSFVAGIMVFKLPELKLVEKVITTGRINFPYIPGLLTFREGPALLTALARLQTLPDCFLFDGQGIAHPRGMGLASHLGLLLDIPSVGCAKRRLVGEYQPPGPGKGDSSLLILDGQPIGRVLRTKEGVKPVFVSPGHLMGIDGAAKIVLDTCRGYRLPQPIRQTHLLVKEGNR